MHLKHATRISGMISLVRNTSPLNDISLSISDGLRSRIRVFDGKFIIRICICTGIASGVDVDNGRFDNISL